MLRKLFFLTSFVLVLGLVGPVAAQDMEIGLAAQPPVIDGEVDEIWADASMQYFVPLDDPANASGSWQVLYDSENLYVLVDVTDDILHNDSAGAWQDDSVEIYFDGGNTKLDTPLSGDDHQYTFGWATDEIQGTNIDGATEGIEHGQVDTDTGWRIEIKMPWLSLQGAAPQAGDLIGIDCYYNDDDDGGDSREGKMLSFSAVEGWNDASQWGTAILAAVPEPAAVPVLKLDVGNSHNAEELEEGFTSFTLDESGSDVDGITVEFAGINAGDARRRGDPAGVPFENIYRDFIFGRQSEPGVGYVSVTLSGLQANQPYEITLYSWDVGSKGIRIADWTANGESIFSTIHDGNVDLPAAEDDYAYTEAATADANGVILMEAVPGEGTLTDQPFAFINALMLVPVPVDPGTDGLVAYYPLENDVLDSSGNGNNGTIVGAPTFVDGPVGLGMAMEFDGESYVDVGNDASLDITGPISMGIWIRPGADDPEGQGTEAAVMAKADSGSSPPWSWQVRYGWNSPQPYMAFTFNTSPRAWVYVGENLERDEWAHIACSHDGATLKCYLNGEQTDSTPMGAITSSPTPVLIGSDGWRSDWIGAIDEVAIYDRALSDGEISYLAGFRADVENLAPNPSFEEDEVVLDDPDWFQWSTWNPAEGAGSNATIVDTDSVDGTKSLRIEPVGVENWHFIVVNISFPADLNKNYTTGFWAKAEAPRPLTVQMKASDNSVDAWGATDFELTTEWAEYNFTSEALHTDVKLEFLCAGSEVPFWLDLVSVYEAD